MLPRELKIIKPSQYSFNVGETELALPPQKAPYTAIIKRFQIDYSYEQKYKLGILSIEEYVAWQIQLNQKTREEQEGSKQNHTFWENDEVERLNISDEDYDQFLAQNQIDVSNNNDVDIEALLKAGMDSSEDGTGEAVSESEAMEQAVAQAVTSSMPDPSDLPGGDDPNRVLTPEEIQALFAAMGVD